MLRWLCLVVLCLVPVAASAQTSPCDVPQGTVANPGRAYIKGADLTQLNGDGTPKVASVLIAIHRQGSATPEFPAGTVTRAQFVDVAGFPDCKLIQVPAPTGITWQAGVNYEARARFVNSAGSGPEAVSNPFTVGPVIPPTTVPNAPARFVVVP